MTITFFSNYLNIHQLPFCLELIKHIGDGNFHFVATSKMSQDRVAMGFEDMNVTKPFVVRAYEGGINYKEAIRLAIESDVAIMGSAPLEYTEARMNKNLLTFQYSERLLKLGWKVFCMPGFYRSFYRQFFRYRKKNMYVLCASAYTAPDLARLCFPRDKCFKWGYFPDVTYRGIAHDKDREEREHPEIVSILWAGRLIGWKHPEMAVELAEKLVKKCSRFSMKIIGDGELKPKLKKMIDDKSLSEHVRILGATSHEDLMNEMKKADLYIFTSDRNEGWGAVLNEAMEAGCVVVASNAIGSVPFLIDNQINGFIFNDGSIQDLFEKVNALIDSPSSFGRISDNAISTVKGEWSIQHATKNLLSLIDYLISGKPSSIKVGPCSPA